MAAPPTTQATAKVTVEVDVYLSQPWGPEATILTVFEQAKKDAIQRVRGALADGSAFAVRTARVTAVLAPLGE